MIKLRKTKKFRIVVILEGEEEGNYLFKMGGRFIFIMYGSYISSTRSFPQG